MSSLPALDWAQAQALLKMAGIRPESEPGLLEGLLCMEDGAMKEFSRRGRSQSRT